MDDEGSRLFTGSPLCLVDTREGVLGDPAFPLRGPTRHNGEPASYGGYGIWNFPG